MHLLTKKSFIDFSFFQLLRVLSSFKTLKNFSAWNIAWKIPLTFFLEQWNIYYLWLATSHSISLLQTFFQQKKMLKQRQPHFRQSPFFAVEQNTTKHERREILHKYQLIYDSREKKVW